MDFSSERVWYNEKEHMITKAKAKAKAKAKVKVKAKE